MAEPRPLRWPPVFPLQKGLVLWLPLDDRSGARAKDRSGRGNHGTLYGPTWVAERSDALSLNGTSDYVSFGDILRFETGDFSVSFWVKYTSGVWAFVTKGFAFHGTNGWGIAYEAGVSVALQGRVGTYGAAPLTAGAWSFVTVTFDRDALGKTYVNAVEKDSYDISDKQIIDGTIHPLFIGSYLGACELKGVIGETRIYSRVLNAAEVKRLYESELMLTRW